MRVITDPIVDTVAFFVVDLFLPQFFRLARRVAVSFFSGVIYIITKTLGHSVADGISGVVAKFVSTLVCSSQTRSDIRNRRHAQENWQTSLWSNSLHGLS